MKYVFICSPYRPVGEDPETELRKNIDQAKRACRLGQDLFWNGRRAETCQGVEHPDQKGQIP